MDLNTILIILGVIALIGLVSHGIWANRREKSQYFDNANAFERAREPSSRNEPVAAPNFTQPAAAQPEPVQSVVETAPQAEPQIVVPQSAVQTQPVFETQAAASQTVDQIKITLAAEQPQPQVNERVEYVYNPEPKQPSLNVAERTLEQVASFAETEEGIDMNAADLRVQLQDAVISQPTLQQPIEEIQTPVQPEPQAESQVEGEFILLYVVAPENRQFAGSALSQSFENLGFVFGQDGLFHRHVDSVRSPVIFSVADINQPGTFNAYMYDFATMGVALFMQVPSAFGNDKANLRMMIQAAKNLADELGGFILTEEQQIFDEVAEQNYLAKL